MDISKYLKRIQYTGEVKPELPVLKDLQLSHLLHVPFENLDIHDHIEILISNSYKKIVLQKRGGFCYELNSIFYELLKKIGFNVKLISARVYNTEKGFGPEYDHMATIAAIENENYLVDVGFGEFAFQPLKIETENELQDPRGVFAMELYDESIVVKKKSVGGNFIPEYLFSQKERKIEEFYEMCKYHQTSDRSSFTQKRLCSLPTLDGRVTLTNMSLKFTRNGTETIIELASETEVNRALKEYFNIEIK